MKKIFISAIVLLFVFACSSKKDVVKQSPQLNIEAEFQQANDKIEKGRFEEAREILKGIKAKDTSGKFATIAQIRIGDTYFKEELYEEASVEYDHFLRVHSYHRYASYAQYKLAMTYFKRIKTVDISYSVAQRALREFNKLLRLYPRNPYVNVVENRIKTCNNILAEYEFYVGSFYFKKGSYKAAAGRFDGIIRDFPNSKKELESLYYLGLSYKNLGEKDKSLQAFTTLIEKYPTTNLSKEAQEIIASLHDQEK
jgi:outer membrane protein assembly factor BamD